MITNSNDYRHIDPRYCSKFSPGPDLAQAWSEGCVLASKAGMASRAECGELRLVEEKGKKNQILDGKGVGVKSTKNQIKNVRLEIKTKNQEKLKGGGNNLKISLEAEKSVPVVSTIKQGVSISNSGKINCDMLGKIGCSMNSMTEWNAECVGIFERKKQRRILPDWIIKGGKKSEPPDTEEKKQCRS